MPSLHGRHVERLLVQLLTVLSRLELLHNHSDALSNGKPRDVRAWGKVDVARGCIRSQIDEIRFRGPSLRQFGILRSLMLWPLFSEPEMYDTIAPSTISCAGV